MIIQNNNNIFLSYKFRVLSKNILVLPIVFFAFFLSCGYFNKPSTEINNNDSVINTELMIDLLTDIHLIEAALDIKQLQNKNVNDYSHFYYSMLLKKYDVTVPEVKASFDYYIKNTDEFEYIYSEVMNYMTQLQSLTVASQGTSNSFSTINLRNKLKRIAGDTL